MVEVRRKTEIPATGSNSPNFVGVAGCAAASCHGGRGIAGGEYTHWATHDAAHRRAYDILLSDDSQSIAQKLELTVSPHKAARCLACHAMDAGESAVIHGERFAIEFGVACESCHGAAGQWVARHTGQTWKSLSSVQKEEFGFRDLRSLGTRADTCVVCHVGSSNGTVDHELIAAGHPRLSFELAAYHTLLPKHWDQSAAVRREPDQELRLWAIGQVAAAKAQSDISISHAEAALRAGSDRVIPDLAEFDCHACHHDLADEDWRGRSKTRGALGTPQWGSWTVAPARWIARESHAVFGPDAAAVEASLEKWALLM
ncbi:MAG TPA: multiheme c-type cytochrome, partial [Planctomycetaceae bacterium]|nr:multiheme c-type cytochrome [Planctomycetaceae bacterium]